jgi:hypothetical protein
MDMTKREVKAALGIKTDAELARFFEGDKPGGLNRWAVGQWADDQPIPTARQWEARAKRPDLFPMPAPVDNGDSIARTG